MGQLARLLALLRDPRAPKLPRALLIAAVVYAISPIDLIPEAIVTPVFGLLDDVTLLWLSARWLFKNDPDRKVDQPTVSGPPQLQ
jgi:uncharacterized membrane protein YkvA (DUF1232 family)